jgi:hypothetical protein
MRRVSHTDLSACHRIFPGLSLQHPIFHPVRGEVLPKLLFHHRFVIRPVAEVHLCLAVAFEGDDVGVNAVKQALILCFKTV